MRLKSLYRGVATNQRIKGTCVANIFMLCLLSPEVWSNANINNGKQRLVRQLNTKRIAANYEDIETLTNSYHQPHFTGNRSVVVQLFEWKFVDIAAECREFLGPQGYAGVQLSPVLEHTVVKTTELNHPWWERLEIISYRFASRSGDESEFWSMSRVCNENGVRIYADVVLNHMAAPLNFLGDTTSITTTPDNEDFIINSLLETNVNISQQSYSNVPYTHLDFHQPPCLIWDNVQDAHEIRNCQLNGHPDLDHSRANVQKHIVRMLNKFIDMGVAGFRIDAAKYMWPIDLKNILKQVKNLSPEFNFKTNSRPFVYHDVFDLGLDTVSKTEYSTYGIVSEYLYPVELSNILKGKVSLSSLINWGPALGFLAHEDSLVFIDSHDTQRGLPAKLGINQISTYKQRIKYIMGNVFMLVHPYGAIKRIMSSYYFPDTNINQGPPTEEADGDEIRSPKYNKQKQCTRDSGWVCEHRWPELLGMLKVANYFKAPGNKEESVIFFQTNGANQVSFCRGYKAFVAINNDPIRDFVKEVFACLEPGQYCDMVTGGKKEGKEECRGKILEINEQGYVKLDVSVADGDEGSEEREELGDGVGDEEEEQELGKIASYGIIVIYVESKIKPVIENNSGAEGSKDNEPVVSNEDEALDEDIEGDANQSKENGDEGDDKDNNDEQNDDEQTKNETSAENENEQDEAEGDGENEVDVEATTSEQSSEVNKESEETTSGDVTADENQSKENAEEEGDVDEQTAAVNEESEKTTSGEVTADENQSKENAEEEGGVDEQTASDAEAEIDEPHEENNETELRENTAEEDEETENSTADKENASAETHSDEEAASVTENLADENVSNENEEKNPNASAEQNADEQNSTTENYNDEADLEEKSDAPAEAGHNQSRNLDERNTEAEEQIEKPSAEVVNELEEAADAAVTAKIQEIQTAGFSSNPAGNNNDG